MKRAAASAERGVVLFVALIILVAMSLAGIALMRSVDTGTIVAGNLAFRQSTMFVADLGIEAARAWLVATAASSPGTLNAHATDQAYCARLDDATIATSFSGACAGATFAAREVTAAPYAPPAGYTVRYVIHRMCSDQGDPSTAAIECVKAAGTAVGGAGGTKGAAVYGAYALAAPVATVYRVTVQVTGPRNSRSYVQAVVF